MESLSSFAHTMRPTAMQSGPSYLAKCSSTCRAMLAAIVLGGIVVATAGWYTLKNRKVRQQQQPEINQRRRLPPPPPIKPNLREIEKPETSLDKLQRIGSKLFLSTAANESSAVLDQSRIGQETDLAQGYFQRLELLEGYYENGFLNNPGPYDSKTGRIYQNNQSKVVREEHRDQVNNIFTAVSNARTNGNFLYTPEPELLKEGLLFLLREDIYEAPQVSLRPPSQQSDAQRLAALVKPNCRPSDEAMNLAQALLNNCPEVNTGLGTGGKPHISLGGVNVYDYCGKFGDVRVALGFIAKGQSLKSDRQVEYIRDFDNLMIALQNAAAKVRIEEKRYQEVKRKLNAFQNKWQDLRCDAKPELCRIIKLFEAEATPRLWKDARSALDEFLKIFPIPTYSLDYNAIDELKEILKDIQTAAEASGAE